MLIHKHKPQDLAERLLREIEIAQGQDIVIFVSGGSLLTELQAVFYQLPRSQIDLGRLEFALVDERYNPYPHHADSNYTQLMQLNGVSELTELGVKFTPVLVEGKSLTETAKTYAGYVLGKMTDPETFTLAILGVGADYHTAGIMPHKFSSTAQFYDKPVVGYEVGRISESDNPYRERITLSFAAIERMDQVWLYAVGSKKEPVISELEQYATRKKILSGDVAKKPALFLATLARVELFTDG